MSEAGCLVGANCGSRISLSRGPNIAARSVMETTHVPDALCGKWLVRREAGFLPGFGLSKIIRRDGRGVTRVLGVPLLPFRVRMRPYGASAELRYRLLPVRDELHAAPRGWSGRGLLFDREFCRFRLVREPLRNTSHEGTVPHF